MESNLKIVKDDEFINLFWKLSDEKESIRLEAGNSLIEFLIKDQKSNGSESEWSKTLTYALGRLTQGLCSGHKSSRIGFSSTLSALLRRFKMSTDADVEKVIDIFNSKLKVVGNKPSEKNDKEVLLGKVFFYLCLIRGVDFQNIEKYTEIVFEKFIELSKKKSYLKMPAFDGLNELVKKCNNTAFEKILWPKLSDLLSCGWENVDPEILLLLHTCNKSHPQMCGSSYLVMNNWLTSLKKNKKAKLFGSHSYPHLGKVFALSTKAHPQMHEVVRTVLKDVKKQDIPSIVKFWKQVVESTLLAGSPEKKFLALRIAIELLPFMDVDHVKSIWSQNIIMALFYALSNKNNSIHALCKNQLAEELEIALKNDGIESEVQLQFLYRLLTSPVGIKLDNLTGTGFIALTVRNLLLPALKKYIEWLKLFYITGNAGSIDIKANDVNIVQKWCGSQLWSLTKVESLKEEYQLLLGILKFLLLYSFFILKNQSILKETLNIVIKESPANVSSSARKNTKQCFLKAFSSVVQAKESKRVVLDKFLVDVLNFCSEMLASDKVACVSPLTTEYKEEWELINNDVNALRKLKLDEFDGNMARVISILIIYNGLIFFLDNEEDKKDAMNTSTELRIVVGEHFTGKEVDAGDNEPDDRDWDAIITEILLSKLARPSHANRMVVDQVFKILCPAVGKLAFTLILDAIDPTTALEEEEDGDDADDMSDSADEEDDSEEHDSAFSESEEEVNDQFKNLVNAALGPAAAVEEKENDEDTDLSDDAMMRLDPMLAEVFRQRAIKRKEKVEIEKSQTDFKIRCLDLIEILASWKPNKSSEAKSGHPILVYGIERLFSFAEHYSQKEDCKKLAEKLALLLRLKVCQSKHLVLKDTSEEECSEIFTDLESLMMSACKAHSQFFCRLASSCGMFLIGTMLDQKNIPDVKDQIINICLKVVKRFIEEEDSVIMCEIFSTFAEKFPEIAYGIIPDLMKYLKGDIKQYKKRQVCTILASILKFNSTNLKATPLISDVFEHSFGTLKHVVETKESYKLRFLSAALDLLHAAMEIHDITDSSKLVETLKQFLELPHVRSKPTIVNKTWNMLSKYEIRPKSDGLEKQKRKKERQIARREKKQQKKRAIENSTGEETAEPVTKKKKSGKKGKHQSIKKKVESKAPNTDGVEGVSVNKKSKKKSKKHSVNV